MTNLDTCTRCGERPAAPGRFGTRCPQCAGEIARERGWEVGEE